MLPSLNSAVSGLQNFQDELDVIGNNVANVNTVGFKSARVEFADQFSETLRGASSNGVVGLQVGMGSLITGIKNQFTQGSLSRTGLQTDLAVSGDGFFVVKDPVSSTQYVTRDGSFHLDTSNFLVTDAGNRVQGFNTSALSAVGDIQIDGTGRPATSSATATVTSFSIDTQGKINVNLSDGTQFTRGQVLMQKFSDPQQLVKEGSNLYSGIGAAGPLGGSSAPVPAAAGTSGLGTIQSGALELSNVDLANEFSNLIITQRAFQGNARIITTSDEILQEVVNLKRS
ncbi:MAG: flagellar hook-basal body complex protein [Verrucomicrobia bacterium]|nr:flagellar hook-basal body complex protein [Verrucomicrobiota bacterium]